MDNILLLKSNSKQKTIKIVYKLPLCPLKAIAIAD